MLVLHALTGDSHVVGAAGAGHPTPGWWGHLIGPGRAAGHRSVVRGGADPLVTDEEVERVVAFLRQQGEPDYVDLVTDEAALDTTDAGVVGGGLGDPAGNGEEAQYAQALQIIAREGKASTSFLQRKMRIGYNSAARLIERMEADGHVSHPDHVGRRQVLIGGQDAEAADSAPW